MLFAYRDAINESTVFSPFELVFGHEVRGPLKLLKEQLTQPQTNENVLQYVSKFQDQLWVAGQVAREHLKGAQARMKVQSDKRAVDRCFDVGDQVLAWSHSGPLAWVHLSLVHTRCSRKWVIGTISLVTQMGSEKTVYVMLIC